jgi:hypothetical protein
MPLLDSNSIDLEPLFRTGCPGLSKLGFLLLASIIIVLKMSSFLGARIAFSISFYQCRLSVKIEHCN